MLTLQAQGTEFDHQKQVLKHTHTHTGMVAYTCNPSAGEAETGEPWGLLTSQPGLLRVSGSKRETLPKRQINK